MSDRQPGEETMKKPTCDAKTSRQCETDTEHVCRLPKGHAGKHKCKLRDEYTNKPCGYEWANRRKVTTR